MIKLLSVPFRLQTDGSPVTVEQDSDEHYAELIASLVVTRPRERKLAPGFGLNDPQYRSISRIELIAGVAAFGPNVKIKDIRERKINDTEQQIVLTFTRAGQTTFEESAVLPAGLSGLPLGTFEDTLS